MTLIPCPLKVQEKHFFVLNWNPKIKNPRLWHFITCTCLKSLRESFFFLSFFLLIFIPPSFLSSLLHCFLQGSFPPPLFHVKTILFCVQWHFDGIHYDIHPFWSSLRSSFIELCVECVLLDPVVLSVKCQTPVCVLKNCNTECIYVCDVTFPSEENVAVNMWK